jgi:hypothetical protein
MKMATYNHKQGFGSIFFERRRFGGDKHCKDKNSCVFIIRSLWGLRPSLL